MLFADGDILTVQNCLIVAVSTMAGVLALLWKIVDNYRRECEEDRRQLWNKLVDMQALTCTDGSCDERQRVSLKISDNISARGKKQLKPDQGPA